MNKERLLTLADFLERKGKFKNLKPIPEGKFDLDNWAVGSQFTLSELENQAEYADHEKDRRYFKKVLKNLQTITRKRGKNYFKAKKEIVGLNGQKELEIIDCKTTACACGWATTIPEFRKAGFKLVGWGGEQYRAGVYYNGKTDFYAVMDFFDIGMESSEVLFMPGKYSNTDGYRPKAVAKRIRELVKTGEVDMNAYWEANEEHRDT